VATTEWFHAARRRDFVVLLKEVKRRTRFSKSFIRRSSETLSASSALNTSKGDFGELAEAALESAESA
jgi:hypothetical protein